jgi:hypothetical protein
MVFLVVCLRRDKKKPSDYSAEEIGDDTMTMVWASVTMPEDFETAAEGENPLFTFVGEQDGAFQDCFNFGSDRIE